jgi:Flp pilus assembly protein TadG
MKDEKQSFLRKVLKNENGQILPWMALLVILFLGMAGLTLDLGHAYVCYRELQASTDAAALAGGYALSLSTATTSSVDTAVSNASSVTGGQNVNINLPSASETPTLECLTTVKDMGIPCSASPTGDNAIQVVQSAVVPTYFIRGLAAFGVKGASSITLTTESTAAMRGATNSPYNVAIIIDTTASMGDEDSDAACGNTQIYCALQGVQVLLKALSPCTAASESGTCVGFDEVSLFTFPNIQANDAADDTTCPTKNPSVPSYYAPTVPTASTTTWTDPTGSNPTYQVTGFIDNYSATNQAGGSLNTSSSLAIAAGASTVSKCTGLQTPGGDGTYYAGAIYAATTALLAEQNARPGSQSALILLSDAAANSSEFQSGFSTSSGTYPSKIDQCQQGVTAAQAATKLGITVYTVSYGASNNASDCSTDSGLTPCQAMSEMASSAADFYSDANSTENKGACSSPDNPSLNLNQIFQQVATSFTVSRLIPNGST